MVTAANVLSKPAAARGNSWEADYRAATGPRWTNNRNVTQLLEFMVQRGEVAVAGRSGRDRLWDLATRVCPDDPPVPVDEALRIRDERRRRPLGIARAREPECPVEPVDVGEAG